MELTDALAGKLESYTIEDIYALPDGQRAELIDGELYMMATPGRIHQRLVMMLSNSIFNYIQSKNGDCEVYPSPFAVFLNADDKIYLEPPTVVQHRTYLSFSQRLPVKKQLHSPLCA